MATTPRPLASSGAMWSHQRACAAPPCTRMMPLPAPSPNSRYAISVPATFTAAVTTGAARACVNQAGGWTGGDCGGIVMSSSEPDRVRWLYRGLAPGALEHGGDRLLGLRAGDAVFAVDDEQRDPC